MLLHNKHVGGISKTCMDSCIILYSCIKVTEHMYTRTVAICYVAIATFILQSVATA